MKTCGFLSLKRLSLVASNESQNKMKIKKEEIKKAIREISKIKNVKAIYLFGSYALKKSHALSDVDLCVIGDLTKKEEIDILGYNTDLLDVVPFSRLPIWIKIRVFKEGKALIEKDTKFVDKIKVKTIQEYLDFKPALDKFVEGALKCTT